MGVGLNGNSLAEKEYVAIDVKVILTALKWDMVGLVGTKKIGYRII